MISWYIDSTRTDQPYLDQVNRIAGPCMDYLCKRLCEVDSFEINDTKRIIEEIIEELPILKIHYYGDKEKLELDKISINYNGQTSIKFNDNLRGVVRDIKLRKILE